MDQQLSPHFSLAELTASQTAARLGIDNTPTPDVLAELGRLAAVLEQVRAGLGAPLLISSGYRSPALNAAVPGSAKNSAHLYGRAADFTCPAVGSPRIVCMKINGMPGLDFDQLIFEFGAWVHFAIAAPGETPRRQVLTIDGAGTRAGL